MEYLFLASIGPVQSFIASARRSRDLYFGSWLLSELAKAATKEIAEIYGVESLIFPAPTNKETLNPHSELNVANKIVARVPDKPQELGIKVHKAISRQLHSIRDKAYSSIEISNVDRQTAYEQIDDLVEYFWVATPFVGDYAKVRDTAEALMASRKNMRDFGPVKWGSYRPKSSIDGQLESVIPENKYPDRNEKNSDKGFNKVRFLYSNYKAGPAERLSGIDLLKRKGKVIPIADFPSTSHIAAISFLERLQTLEKAEIVQARQWWEAYITQVKEVSNDYLEFVSSWHPILDNVEGSLLFEDRLPDLLDFVKSVNSEEYKKAKELLRCFYSHIDDFFDDHARPNPYYAILHADGDRMGEVIERLATEPQGHEQHSKLSKALNAFAGSVRKTVEDHRGALVYAGGDDVLAFLPLHTALECASRLAADFHEKLANFQNDKGQFPTLSVGIAIVHHLHSLNDALNIARAAEKAAKNVPDKDALAITVRKRSGGEYTVTGHWNNFDTNLEKLISYYQKNDIPAGMAYELQGVVHLLTIPDVSSTKEYQTLQKAAYAEVDRILKRKMGMMHKDDTKVNDIVNSLLAILGIASDTESQPFSVQAENFINMLLAAQIFAQANKLAKPDR